MKVLVIGANGKIGKQIVTLLGKSEKHEVRAMIREKSQAMMLETFGAQTVVADLERDFSDAVEGCNAVIFTAGSGPHTGPDKTIDVDRDGAIRAVEMSEAKGVKRFIMVSAMNVETPEKSPEKLRHYLEAKLAADQRLEASDLNYTIVRPGRLTNDPGKGAVAADDDLERGEIPRADVAATIVAALDIENTYDRAFDLLSGDTEVEEALKTL